MSGKKTQGIEPAGRLLLVLLLPLFLSGCLGRGDGGVITASAEALIPAELTGPGDQQRQLPWSDKSLEASASYSAEAAQDSAATYSPGVARAILRLEARRRAREILARKLAVLVAADAPPGESGKLSLLELSRRDETIDRMVKSMLFNSTEEAFTASAAGGGLVKLEMELEPLARVVLEEGGGFLASDRLIAVEGQEARARAEADRRARRALAEEIAHAPLRDNVTIGDWIGASPVNREMALNAIRSARVVPGESGRKTIEGTEVYVVQLEFDLEAFRREILEIIKKQEKERSANAAADTRLRQPAPR